MKFRLIVVPWSQPGPKSDAWRFPALAWTDRNGSIFARPLAHRLFFARARLAHEVEHHHDDFPANSDHHPWWHFCGRVGHALRLLGRRHITTRSWGIALVLQWQGGIDARWPK